MECPYCKENMLMGWIHGDGRLDLEWIEDTLLKDTAIKVRLNKVKKNPLKMTKAKSWHCSNCKKIIIDVTE